MVVARVGRRPLEPIVTEFAAAGAASLAGAAAPAGFAGAAAAALLFAAGALPPQEASAIEAASMAAAWISLFMRCPPMWGAAF